MSVAVARYHALKYVYLERLHGGDFVPLVDAYRELRLATLFALARDALDTLTPPPPG